MHLNIMLLASFLGLAAALRRGCRHDTEKPEEGFYYVENNDKLETVAQDFCTTPDIIKQWNAITDLTPSTNIRVPCRERKRDCMGDNDNNNGDYTTLLGDKVSDIAKDFCTDPKTIEDMNKNIIRKGEDIIDADWSLRVPCPFNT